MRLFIAFATVLLLGLLLSPFVHASPCGDYYCGDGTNSTWETWGEGEGSSGGADGPDGGSDGNGDSGCGRD